MSDPGTPEMRRLALRRMRSTRLIGDRLSEPEPVVGWFGAMQAQEYEPAKWAVGMRANHVGNDDLDRSVDKGTILRTHALRPTWHFVLPEDIGWLQRLTGPRVHVTNGHMYRLHGLDEMTRGRTESLIVGWLENEGHLTRKEIGQRLETDGIPAEGNRLAYIVMSAELNGLVASGVRKGASQTYALVSERVLAPTELTQEEALAELTLRYFRSHGPATIGDMRWWSSLTRAHIRQGLDSAGDSLHRERFGELEVWSADIPEPATGITPIVHLLQPYDEHIVAFRDTKHVIEVPTVAGRPPTIDGRAFFSALLIDGQLAGWWRRSIVRGVLDIEVRQSRPLSDAELEALHEAALGYGRFHDIRVTVAVDP